jgi:hypothetical protein
MTTADTMNCRRKPKSKYPIGFERATLLISSTRLALSMSSANSFYQERLKDKFLEKAMKDATSDGTNGHTNGTSDPMNPLMLEAEMFAIKVGC